MPDRTTIVLPIEVKKLAVLRAREQGISFGEFVRRAIERQLPAPSKAISKFPWQRGFRNTGDPFWDNMRTFDDGGPTDMSIRVDDYLYKALEDELRRHGSVSGPVSPKGPVQQRGRPDMATARTARVYKQSRHR